jgi:hypothetical protein
MKTQCYIHEGCYDELVQYVQGHVLMIGGIALASIVVIVSLTLILEFKSVFYLQTMQLSNGPMVQPLKHQSRRQHQKK